METPVGGRIPPAHRKSAVVALQRFRWLGITATAIACALAATSSALAESAAPADSPVSSVVLLRDPVPVAGEPAEAHLRADIDANKSYWIPAAEILGFDLLLNGFNRTFIDDAYKSNASSIRRNLSSSWNVDNDPFTTNQLGHPYQGSMYHGFARSAGLNYWESLGYTVVGSAAWEIAGETTPPSRNDQITTGFGGSFLGESLFRMSNLVLEQSDLPKFWRELAAAAISPPTGFNRAAFGDRFDTVFPSNDPVYYGRLSLGVATSTRNRFGPAADFKHTEALADFTLDHGLPGEPGYQYKRPFDHFVFKATVSSANGLENMMTRGLLVGTDYGIGDSYRGVWGLYGSYDYMEPRTFRVSSTAVSVGTTGQWWLSQAVALQGSALVGTGYATVGSVNARVDNDLHYGVAPQALLALRLVFGDRVSLDTVTRGYFVSGVGGVNTAGRDNIYRADMALTMRVKGQHAISIRYQFSRRDVASPVFGDRSQSGGTVGVFYTCLGSDDFGVVDWRNR